MEAIANISHFFSQEWDSFHSDSEVWVFQANRELSMDEAKEMKQLALQFARNDWDSHGVNLHADALVVYNRFLIFIADSANSPGGCSKDSMTQFVQKIGRQFQIDFFDRMQVIYKDSTGKLNETSANELKGLMETNVINGDTIVYNNLVSRKEDLVNDWETMLKNSWHARFAS